MAGTPHTGWASPNPCLADPSPALGLGGTARAAMSSPNPAHCCDSAELALSPSINVLNTFQGFRVSSLARCPEAQTAQKSPGNVDLLHSSGRAGICSGWVTERSVNSARGHWQQREERRDGDKPQEQGKQTQPSQALFYLCPLHTAGSSRTHRSCHEQGTL